MAIVIVNPNSTDAMTDAMVEAARLAAPGVAVQGRTTRGAPPAIQGRDDGAAATPLALAEMERAAEAGASGIVIGCFDDTGLAEAAALPCPVLGIGQAAYHYAALRQWRFSVVTTLPVSVPILEENITRAGLTPWLGRVRASDVPVLEVEENPQIIIDAAQRAVAEDGAQAIVLGCAGMVQITRAARDALPVPVIDPVEAAIGGLGWLI